VNDRPPPRPVDFDLGLSFPGKDATPEEYANANPGMRILEVRIPISANFRADESAVESIIHRIRVSRSIDIVDFLPRTEVGSEMAAPYLVGGKYNDRSAKVTSTDGGTKVGFTVKGVAVEGTAAGARKEEGATWPAPQNLVQS
jgi:hypothetical protein